MVCAKFVKENWWIVLFVSGHLEGKIWELQVWGLFVVVIFGDIVHLQLWMVKKWKTSTCLVKGVDVEKALVGKCTKVVDKKIFEIWNTPTWKLQFVFCKFNPKF